MITFQKSEADMTPEEHHWLAQHVQHLQVAIEHELRLAGPVGISELELIRVLQGERWQLIGPVDFHQPSRLYPVHFLVFHALYRLQDQMAREGEGLDISPLRLAIRTLRSENEALLPDSADPLKDFYLDLTQYFMANADIEDMLNSFWAGTGARKPAPESVESAARVFGFEALPEQFITVKQRFRRLVMRAHPDRGGCTNDIQQLNLAFSVLKQHYA
ncbi:molecular chaperone DnaJ [Marinobacter fuscus]|uniref:Molecular chaperone DnaJ n=1 Tax=Marinobacter fuscus TaxID=2109942 RepID=A0A2T1K639_9GAMM|nr:DNA-J related domain-containing protein [Marinobacter fuscus]PSF04982.1 molecular chaperone DnaJ [Marinobacter fuscus]